MLARELRLKLARLGKLAALVLNLVEQAHVLDRDSGLVGKGHYQPNLPVGERPHRVSCQSDNAYWRSVPQHWDAKQGTKATNRPPLIGVFWIGQNIGNVNDPSLNKTRPETELPSIREG
jgi:hypothetical protein